MPFNSIKINITRSKKIYYTGTNVFISTTINLYQKSQQMTKQYQNKFMFKAVQLVIKQMNLKSTIAS